MGPQQVFSAWILELSLGFRDFFSEVLSTSADLSLSGFCEDSTLSHILLPTSRSTVPCLLSGMETVCVLRPAASQPPRHKSQRFISVKLTGRGCS